MTVPKGSSISDEQLNRFRYRVLIVLLLVLVVLLAARSCSSALQPAPPTEPPLPGVTASITTGPTDTPAAPPAITPSPPTLVPPTQTATLSPSPTAPPTEETPPPTETPTLVVPGADCSEIGEDRGSVWIVRGCDTLYRISQLTGVSLEAILAANPEIFDPDIIFPGQIIRLPGRS